MVFQLQFGGGGGLLIMLPNPFLYYNEIRGLPSLDDDDDDTRHDTQMLLEEYKEKRAAHLLLFGLVLDR